MYVGVCMPVCSCVCSHVAYSYVKPYLCVYAIHTYDTAHTKMAIPTRHSFYSYKLNCTLRLQPQKDWSVCTCQSRPAQRSRQQLQFTQPKKPRPDCQPSAARSVFLDNSGNICRCGLACAAIYSLRVSCSELDTFLLLGIRPEKPTYN